MSDYSYLKGAFKIKNYDTKKTFASFLPSIAGERGIPLWCYYVNRGQCVSSFGIRDKDGSILEFYPANTSYRIVDKYGFRTFIKINGKVIECFSPNSVDKERELSIFNYALSIEEKNIEDGLDTKVTYYGLPNENIGALVRRVEITNESDKDMEVEVLDGLTQLLPYGIGEWSLKHQSNLMKSWFDAKRIDNNLAFYFMNSLPGDEAEVKESEEGNYYFSSSNGVDYGVIYDANVVFGLDTTLSLPLNFNKMSLKEISNIKQVSENKVGVGFTGSSKLLKTGEKLIINTLIGYTPNEETIKKHAKDFKDNQYLDKKYKEASLVIENLLKDINTETNSPLFDDYLKQCYLDNLLRGGYPKIIKTEKENFVYHLFSRRHGDLEREYNFFSIAPEFYSQGNGNFRDVCQNRRSDNLFHKDVETSNIKTFMSLIQLDGYNPLKVEGAYFIMQDLSKLDEHIDHCFENGKEIMKEVLSHPFTPGIIFNTMEHKGIKSVLSDDKLLSYLIGFSIQDIHASFGEGYWVDHWTYIIDLIENAIKIYPEKKFDYLYKEIAYRYFESPVYVLPRSEKYVLNKKGCPSQYGSLIENDKTKIEALKLDESCWAKDQNDQTIYVSLYAKLLGLALIKFDSLDYEGMGIEMDANKPGWNDAMNGLPGIFGSGVSETIELGRVLSFLIDESQKESILLPDEVLKLFYSTKEVIDNEDDPHVRWNKLTCLKENYRLYLRTNRVKLVEVNPQDLLDVLNKMKSIVDDGINKAYTYGNGVIPTFIVRKAVAFKTSNEISGYGLPKVSVNDFESRALPPFLEAPARSFKYVSDKDKLHKMYEQIKNTDLYDAELKMYKTSSDLDKEGYDIGRIRAFRKGWLERESNFTHMTFKYLLGLLKAGFYDEFYDEIKTNFTCFMDPSVYGRSLLENSSFIATSNNPDASIHGQGFVSRLTGANSEVLSMYETMFFGDEPFTYKDELILEFKPVLHKSLFKKDGTISTTFLSKIKITYHNENFISTYDENIKVKKIILIGKNKIEIDGPKIIGELANKVRNFDFCEIHVYY